MRNHAGGVQGVKMHKDRITISVCVNATGNDRLKLVVIHTAKRPRDFGRVWQPSEFVDYFSNTKAWMTMQACFCMCSKLSSQSSSSAQPATPAFRCLRSGSEQSTRIWLVSKDTS